jgi:hypothetical protein
MFDKVARSRQGIRQPFLFENFTHLAHAFCPYVGATAFESVRNQSQSGRISALDGFPDGLQPGLGIVEKKVDEAGNKILLLLPKSFAQLCQHAGIENLSQILCFGLSLWCGFCRSACLPGPFFEHDFQGFGLDGLAQIIVHAGGQTFLRIALQGVGG